MLISVATFGCWFGTRQRLDRNNKSVHTSVRSDSSSPLLSASLEEDRVLSCYWVRHLSDSAALLLGVSKCAACLDKYAA